MNAGARLALSLAASFLVALPAVAWGQAADADDPAAIEFFEKKVRPLLADNCYNCHSANTNSQGGLRVDDRNGLVLGGDSGPAVVPGKPDESLLIRAVSYSDADLKMPPKKQLSAEQVADLTRWIQDGAVWPKVRLPEAIGTSNPEYTELTEKHWAWQPIRPVQVPMVRDTDWARNEIDAFILARLEEKGIEPVGDADKLVLIRRLTFDLTGLPPTPEEIEAFLGDASAEAYERLVDRLLASPAFGERWGRHWLDVARYGESTGSSRNLPYPHAWRYRDYVIDAFNDDKPCDQFIREQIAGDLLPANSPQQKVEQLVATGFLAVGVKDVNQRFKIRFIMDNIDEQIDTVSRSILGLTASCARCHDHKFDPIPTADYYALVGIFQSTDLCAGLRNKMGGGGLDYYDSQMLLRIGFETKEMDPKAAKEIEKATKKLADARAELEALRGKPEGDEPGDNGRPKRAAVRQKVKKLQNELLALADPVAQGGQAALGVREGRSIGDAEIRIRGEAEKVGPVVPRGFLSLLHIPDAPSVNPRQSGRLELAHWLTSAHNPLTPRVMANRVWQHLFGAGLVKSVDNFGVTGDVPSHPELLDYLATRLVRDGWSVKKLIRAIVVSRAYRLSSAESAAAVAVDPDARLVWRHNPRRLDAEEIRDAALSASGRLDRARPEGSAAKDLKVVELRNNGPEARQLSAAVGASTHRSVYLPLVRGLTPTALEVFDFAEQGMVTGSRSVTTVPTQALYMLNDPFVRQQSLAIADRLLARSDLDDAARVDWVYRRTVGRAATPKEIARAKEYVAAYAAVAVELAAQAPPQVAGEPVAATADNGNDGGGAAPRKKPAPPPNPDDVVEDEPVVEETIQPTNPAAAAWASFCQAVLGSAEFRYLK
ncbi:MAG: PSD1 domain-containing protein [Planctomycetia bacterium]|nr:PSD1 domain-containing protein [Planctomycetia bacterium]